MDGNSNATVLTYAATVRRTPSSVIGLTLNSWSTRPETVELDRVRPLALDAIRYFTLLPATRARHVSKPPRRSFAKLSANAPCHFSSETLNSTHASGAHPGDLMSMRKAEPSSGVTPCDPA
jgi:hypothetical protein